VGCRAYLDHLQQQHHVFFPEIAGSGVARQFFRFFFMDLVIFPRYNVDNDAV